MVGIVDRCDVDVRDARPTLEAKTRVESARDHFDICFPRRIVFVKSYGLEHHTHVSRTLYSYLSDDMHLIHGAHVPHAIHTYTGPWDPTSFAADFWLIAWLMCC